MPDLRRGLVTEYPVGRETAARILEVPKPLQHETVNGFEGMGVRKMEVEKRIDDELERAIEAGMAEMRDPALNPQEVAARGFHRVATSGPAVHETKKSQALALIGKHRQSIMTALRRGDYGEIDGLLSKFFSEYRYAGLSTPAVEPTPRDLYERTFARWGWLGDEIDAAFARIKPGERVTVDWDRFTVGERTISRESIRLGLKPRFSSASDASWLARFPQMKRAILDHGDVVFTGTGSA